MDKKLLLLDGMAIVYRAYYALNRNPRINSKGLNTSAILGFTTTLYDLMRSQKPTHIGVAFDLQAPTFRHEKFDQYKANRDAMPEDIQRALPYIKEIVEGFNIPILTSVGYEADDVIGTLAKQAQKHHFKVLMVTPDKDFGQLVSENISMYRFGRMGHKDEILGVSEILEKFSIRRCEQVIDILGLWGDSSDNIPGIPGIGEKKAKQLIHEFDSIENLIAHADEIANEKLRNLVKEHAEQALFSKELATIALDTPIAFNEKALEVERPNFEKLKALFSELEFRNFAKRIFADYAVSFSETITKPIESVPVKIKEEQNGQQNLFDIFEPGNTPIPTFEKFQEKDYVLLSHKEEQQHFLETIKQQELYAFHILTDTRAKTIEGIAFCSQEKKATYIPIASTDSLEALRILFSDLHAVKICYNAKQIKALLREKNIEVLGTLFDIQIAHYLLNSESRHTLDFIAGNLLNYMLSDIESLLGKPEKGSAINFALLDQQQLKNCTCESAEVVYKLYPILNQQIQDTHIEKLFWEVEMPLVDVLLGMEQEGIRIDIEYLKQYSEQLQNQKNDIEHKIFDYAEKIFNISSPKQLGEILYEKLKIVDKPAKTATKQYSTAEDVLQKIIHTHPIVPLILEYRSLTKLIGTYLDALPKLIEPATRRLHTTFNQTVTATGRLSSNNPNLQNIPIRTERGREIRKAFVPRDENYVLMAADYSQIELRIIASLSRDQHMMAAFSQHYDIHTATAAKIYKIPMDEITPTLRRNAKSVNFGIVYGISPFGLSEQLGIPRKEASALIDEYFAQYPDIKKYIENNVAFAREHGYAQTLLGRRRYLPEINSRNNNLRSFAERNAVNMPIQGTSADMIKIAMNGIFKEFTNKNLKSKMVLQVHDELVFDVHKQEQEQVSVIVRDKMLSALPLEIPVEVNLEIGENWLEAH